LPRFSVSQRGDAITGILNLDGFSGITIFSLDAVLLVVDTPFCWSRTPSWAPFCASRAGDAVLLVTDGALLVLGSRSAHRGTPFCSSTCSSWAPFRSSWAPCCSSWTSFCRRGRRFARCGLLVADAVVDAVFLVVGAVLLVVDVCALCSSL
jgi:hypothetical protein